MVEHVNCALQILTAQQRTPIPVTTVHLEQLLKEQLDRHLKADVVSTYLEITYKIKLYQSENIKEFRDSLSLRISLNVKFNVLKRTRTYIAVKI